MEKQQNPVVITEEDYNLLRPFINGLSNRQDKMTLAYELQRAVIVRKDAFPPNTVGLNSVVSVEDVETHKTSSFKIVMPECADIRKQKISVLTPMGTALLGFRKGEEVEWQMPAGMKKLRIIDVMNHHLSNQA